MPHLKLLHNLDENAVFPPTIVKRDLQIAGHLSERVADNAIA